MMVVSTRFFFYLGGCLNNWTSHFGIGSAHGGRGDMATAGSVLIDAEDRV